MEKHDLIGKEDEVPSTAMASFPISAPTGLACGYPHQRRVLRLLRCYHLVPMTSLARVCSVRGKWQGDQRDLGFASGPPRISNQVRKYSLFSTLYHHFWNNQNNIKFLKIFSSQSLSYLQKLCIANIELQHKYKPRPHSLCRRNTRGVKNQTPQTWEALNICCICSGLWNILTYYGR